MQQARIELQRHLMNINKATCALNMSCSRPIGLLPLPETDRKQHPSAVQMLSRKTVVAQPATVNNSATYVCLTSVHFVLTCQQQHMWLTKIAE